MADYIYLLESRLSRAQQKALQAVREIARTRHLTVFLVGGAVRDLTSGSPVRDLDFIVQGNALKLRKDIEKAGGKVVGEMEAMQALFVYFPGSVRVEIGSALSVQYPKPGKPVVKPATILEDLRRRDFTANAMALSLNEGSYGLLMDPLNGVADIENRELRLVSNYGFIEDPVRLVRAARFAARLGWQMEERTRARYESGKTEDYISAMSSFQRGYEAEEVAHEEDPLRVIRRLEQEGWMKYLHPAWTSAKASVSELEKLRDAQMQLQTRGIDADTSALQFPLLTAKMQSKDVSTLKKSFPRQGFVAEIEAAETEGKRFVAELTSKQAAAPSAAWKLLMSARPESVLWAAYAGKGAAVQAKFKAFYTDWPQARQKIPYTLMQEMRIVPELPGYDELVEKLFFELMDGKLSTVEEMKAYLEPYSPPAPPPPVHLRRPRPKKETKAARRKKAESGEAATGESPESAEPAALAVDGQGSPAPASGEAAVAAPAKASVAKEAKPATGKPSAAKPAPAKAVPAKAAVKAAPAVKIVPKKAAPAKVAAKKAVKKAEPKPAAKKAGTQKPRPAAKPPAKNASKGATKTAKPVKKSGAKPVAKKAKGPTHKKR